MSQTVDQLRVALENARQEHGYSTTCLWYREIRSAISCIELATQSGSAKDEFGNLWLTINFLYKMMQQSAELENKAASRWGKEIVHAARVRECLDAISTEDLKIIKAAESKLLWDFKERRWREGRTMLDAWVARKQSNPERSIQYLLGVCRDCRNTVGAHANVDPGNARVRRGFEALVRILEPFSWAAVEAMIQHPLPGTTGRVPTYRGFLWPYLTNADSFFSDYYLENLLPERELGANPRSKGDTEWHFPDNKDTEDRAKVLREVFEDFRTRGNTANVAETATEWCEPSLFPMLGLEVASGLELVTEEYILQPTYVIPRIDQRNEFPTTLSGKEALGKLEALIWVIPWRSSLDDVYAVYDPNADEALTSLTLIEVAHRSLASADIPWAILTNGCQLRLLHKSNAHKGRCFLEIDLAAILARRGDAQALLAFRYFLGLFAGEAFTKRERFEGEDRSRLERVQYLSERYAKVIGDELKQNVFRALELLGDGFLHYLRTHPAALEEWRITKAPSLSAENFLKSKQLLNDIYHESLSLMYRLLFLFYAESRNLLPIEDEMYRESYSLESIRDDIISVHDDPDLRRFFGRGDTYIWERLTELCRFLNTGWRDIIPAYNGGLFDPELHIFLERYKVPDYFLAQAVDLLSRTQPRFGQSRGEGRKKVTYRDLDIRHLGSIYEGILEYSAHIADQDIVVMKRGSGTQIYKEPVSISELTDSEKEQLKVWQQAKEENSDNPLLPRGCKVDDFKERGRYYLVYGGRESKRKSSGSYYTPDYIVQYIVEHTLGPLVRGECRHGPEPLPEELKRIGAQEKPTPTGPLSSDEILNLKVLDPAMGSGHFLVAATEYLARAYGEALIREGSIASGAISDEDFIRHKRTIVERCIYGVDINPMAVELAKLSLWLFTMDRSRPLSFLNHHLKWGNSLIGAWIKELGELPAFDRNGKLKKIHTTDGQANLFEEQFKAKIPLMIRDLFGILSKETLTRDDIETKKALDKAIEELKRPFKNVANAWVAIFFGEETKDYNALLSNVEFARTRESRVAEEHRFFHWELEFPEIFFDRYGRTLANSGFSAVLGNPPYLYSAGKKLVAYFKRYLLAEYQTDYYVYFFERGFSLLEKGGFFSMISPDSWLANKYFRKLRGYLLDHRFINEICIFTEPPFEDAVIENAILIANIPAIESIEREFCNIRTADTSGKTVNFSRVPYNHLSKRDGRTIPIRYNSDIELLLDYIEDRSNLLLGDKFKINRGIHDYRTDGYGKSKFIDGHQTIRDKKERSYHANYRVDSTYRPHVKGKDISLFSCKDITDFVSYGDWLAEPRTSEYFKGPRIVSRKIIGKRIISTIFTDDSILDQSLYVSIPKESLSIKEIQFYLGQIVTRIPAFYLRNKYQIFDSLYPWFTREQMSKIPMISVEISESVYNNAVDLVEEIVKCKNKKEITRIIENLDKIFFKLYEMSNEQINTIISQEEI